MGYHGVLSKGCERCRKRRIKCDQERPGCMKCSKLNEACPGYRDLNEARFRIENSRIVRKASRCYEASSSGRFHSDSESGDQQTSLAVVESTFHWQRRPGHDFYFETFAATSSPFRPAYNDWVKELCTSRSNGCVVADAVEAVGLAGLANVSSARHIRLQAYDLYCCADRRLNSIMLDPEQRLRDETLLASILLCLFQAVYFDSWDSHSVWANQVWRAMQLIDDRGAAQFDHQRGGQLYAQARQQVLCLCIQLHQPVPPALVNATYIFENAELRQIWRDSHFASPASMSVISFQLVNLRAAIKHGHITDHTEIHERAMTIDRDLQAWESVLPADWKRSELPKRATDTPVDFAQHQFGYLNTWLAEIHCTYRVLRVACLQLLIQEGSVAPEPYAVDTIRQMSEEVCCSVAVFDNNPRALSLIRHLYVVAMEDVNHHATRKYAAEALQAIGRRMGVKFASDVAELVLGYLEDNSNTGGFARLACDTVPIAVPF